MIKQREVPDQELNDVEMVNANNKDQQNPASLPSSATELDSFDLRELSRYWDEYIQDVIVDRSRAVDNELAELQ